MPLKMLPKKYKELEGKILEAAKQHSCKRLANLLKNAETDADDNPEKKSGKDNHISTVLKMCKIILFGRNNSNCVVSRMDLYAKPCYSVEI